MAAILSLRQLAKSYASGLQALKGVDLDIERGEIFALLGPNGAGKTTLINIVCGIVTPTSGNASYSAANAITGPGCSPTQRATNAVSRPPAGAVTSKPCRASSSAVHAAAWRSSKAISGVACTRWDSSSASGMTAPTASSNELVAAGSTMDLRCSSAS